MGAERLPSAPGSREPDPLAVPALRASIPSAGNFYRTCKNCAFEPATCDRRAAVEAGIRGLGLTAVKFRCDQRQPFFRMGQRVGVTWKFVLPEWDWGYEEGLSHEEWPATVVAETTRGFRIVVDDVRSDHDTPARSYIKNESLYCNVTASRLRPLDEPDRAVCTYCGSAENADGTVTGCWGTGVRVPDCLAQAIEARSGETRQRLDPKDESAVGAADASKTQPHLTPEGDEG